MALIKCSECGKEYSNTVKRCPNCGYKPSRKERNGNESNNNKNKRTLLIVLGVILSLIIIGCFVPSEEEEKNKGKDKEQNTIIDKDDKSNQETDTKKENDSKKKDESKSNKEKEKEEKKEPIVEKTPREKLVIQLEKSGWTCSGNKCTYTFTIVGNTDYYTIDFDNKTSSIDSNSSSASWHKEYNYGTEKGYLKYTDYTGWTVTTEVKYTYNKSNNTYRYDCTSSLNGYCESTGSELGKMLDDLRVSLVKDCNAAGISVEEL